jgi:RNA polymerase sigma factor (sigma-70 family)
MASRSLAGVLRHVPRLLGLRAGSPLTDADLLVRFAEDQDQAAFATLVQRHGPTVWGVCLRVLGNSHDAEDAFQATFLVLARRAGSIAAPQLLGQWLHGVAWRIATKARTQAAIRHAQERKALAMLCADVADDDPAWHDLRPVLDQEVQRLPEKYRALIVLCYFEGKPYEEVARLLDCPAGTVSGRLARARQLLRERLSRRGITHSATAIAAVIAANATAAPVPSHVMETTVEAAGLYAAGASMTGIVGAHVVALAEGGIRAMLPMKAKLLLAIVLALGVVGGGSLLLPGDTPAESALQAAEPAPASPAEAARPAGLEGIWADLASGDDTAVTRAILTLSKDPKKTEAFLKGHLRAVKADPKRVATLIADLESNQFEVRQKAFDELEYLGKYIKGDLEKALAGAGPESKKRIQQLIDRMPVEVKDAKKAPPMVNGNVANVVVRVANGQRQMIINGVPVEGPGNVGPVVVGPSSYWLRAVRAIAILEDIGTPEAKAIIEELAKGEADALPTEKAKAALERWGKK